MGRNFLLAVIVALGGVVVAFVVSAQTSTVDFPVGYRDWAHVKSMVIRNGHALFESFGGLHHIYANEEAMDGYRTGSFEDGSILVFDLFAVSDAENATVETTRKVLGVMRKNAMRYTETGGWGYEAFAQGDPAQRVVGDQAATACHACHQARHEAGYVFSAWRE